MQLSGVRYTCSPLAFPSGQKSCFPASSGWNRLWLLFVPMGQMTECQVLLVTGWGAGECSNQSYNTHWFYEWIILPQYSVKKRWTAFTFELKYWCTVRVASLLQFWYTKILNANVRLLLVIVVLHEVQWLKPQCVFVYQKTAFWRERAAIKWINEFN